MKSKRTYAVNDQHDLNKVYYYSGGFLVAELDTNTDVIEFHAEMTDEEKNEAYSAMVREHESFCNEFNVA